MIPRKTHLSCCDLSKSMPSFSSTYLVVPCWSWVLIVTTESFSMISIVRRKLDASAWRSWDSVSTARWLGNSGIKIRRSYGMGSSSFCFPSYWHAGISSDWWLLISLFRQQCCWNADNCNLWCKVSRVDYSLTNNIITKVLGTLKMRRRETKLLQCTRMRTIDLEFESDAGLTIQCFLVDVYPIDHEQCGWCSLVHRLCSNFYQWS